MARFTDEELARKVGYSPELLAALNMDDGEWEKKGAELRAAHAQNTHESEMAKSKAIHEFDNLRFDESVISYANHLKALPENLTKPYADIVEEIVAPHREKFVASMETTAPVTVHKIGLNESAFLKLLGGK